MDELKETEPKFRFTTMNGYMILDRHYHDDGRLDILAVRQFNHGDNCYYVGRGYDVTDGQCVSGLFAYSFDEAQSAWDKVRGFDYEKSVVLDQMNQHRSIVVPVKDGYLVAQGHSLDTPRSGEISLEFWNRSGELVSDIANVAQLASGDYSVEAYDFGYRTSGHFYTFDAVDVARQPVSVFSEARGKYLKLPNEVDDFIPETLDEVRERVEKQKRGDVAPSGEETLSRYVVGGVEGVTWEVTVDAHSETEALELAEQAYEAYFEDPAYVEDIEGVVEFDHGWDAEHTTKIWDVQDVPAERSPGELKSAGKAPVVPQVEKASPTQDARSCSQSAKVQAVDAILERVNSKKR